MNGISAAAQVQRRLWGTDPRAWAELAEAHNRPLFEAVLDAGGAALRGTGAGVAALGRYRPLGEGAEAPHDAPPCTGLGPDP